MSDKEEIVLIERMLGKFIARLEVNEAAIGTLKADQPLWKAYRELTDYLDVE